MGLPICSLLQLSGHFQSLESLGYLDPVVVFLHSLSNWNSKQQHMFFWRPVLHRLWCHVTSCLICWESIASVCLYWHINSLICSKTIVSESAGLAAPTVTTFGLTRGSSATSVAMAPSGGLTLVLSESCSSMLAKAVFSHKLFQRSSHLINILTPTLHRNFKSHFFGIREKSFIFSLQKKGHKLGEGGGKHGEQLLFFTQFKAAVVLLVTSS